MIDGIVREHIVKRFTRSSRWPKFRKRFLKYNPECAACGSKKNLQVHHIIPIHVDPSLELDWRNLITLCGRCHLLIGHLACWKCYNSDVKVDAKKVRNKIESRIC